MKYNRLGTSGLFVSELSLGTMAYGKNQAPLASLTEQDANALVAKAFEAGVNMFDTADMYSLGDSERFLGKALRNLGVPRENYLITTKAFGPMGNGPNDSGASRGHLLDAVKTSLKRLCVDHVDLYLIHGFDPATPMEETLRALDDLVRQGHVRYVGVSNWAAWQIAKGLGTSMHLGLSRFSTIEAYYSVAGRDLEREIVPLLESEGVGLMVWSPLAGGLLSGNQARGAKAPEGSRREGAEFPPVDYNRAHDALDVMRNIAETHSVSVAQIALAWLLHQKVVSSVVVGPERIDQLEDTLGAVNVSLTDEEQAAIADVSKLPAEYPGWMIELWSHVRRTQLANSKR